MSKYPDPETAYAIDWNSSRLQPIKRMIWSHRLRIVRVPHGKAY